MKYLIALALSCASLLAQADTPEDRCENVSQYSEAVAKMRDEGWTLREVQEINHDRAGAGLVAAYDMAADMTFKSSLPPADVRKGMLKGCLEAVREHKAGK